MTLETVKLVGYWNKDLNNPEITFKVPETIDDKELVVITLTRVKDDSELVHLNVPKALNNLKKLKKELRNLDIIGRRLK
jgi:hypothetical protein